MVDTVWAAVGLLERKPKARADERLIHAAHWAEALRRGHLPPPVVTPIALDADEGAYGRLPAAIDHFYGVDTPYTQGFFLAGGSVGTLAASAVGSAIFNASARNRAQALAAPQWRVVDQGELVITNRRLVVRGNQGFSEYWYAGIQSAEQDPAGIVLWARDMPTTRIRVDLPEWLAVMFTWLSFGVIAELPLNDEQQQEVERRLASPVPEG